MSAVTALRRRAATSTALPRLLVLLTCVGATVLLVPRLSPGSGLLLVGLVLAAAITAALRTLLPAAARPEAAAQLFVFLLYTNALVIISTFHGAPQSVVSLSYLLLAVPVATYTLLQRQPIVITPSLPLMLLYTAALALSAAFARNTAAAAQPVVAFLSEGLLLYVLMSNAVRSPAALRRVIWVLVVGAVVLGGISMWQEVTGSYDNDLGGLAQTNVDDLKVGEDLDGKVLRDRLGGPMGSPNRYAQILAMVVPLALLRVFGERSGKLRLLAGLGACFGLAGIALTFSRGTAAALVLVAFVMVLLKAIRPRHLLAFLLAFVAVTFVIAPDYFARLNTLRGLEGLASQSVDADGAILGRATSNLASLSVFLDHPVVGVGPLQFFQEYSVDAGNEVGLRQRDGRRRAHNLYFEAAADTGIIGLAAFLAIPIMTLVQLGRVAAYWRRRQRPELTNLAHSLFLSVVAYLATGLFLHLSYQRYLWMFLGLANAGVWVLRREAEREAAESGMPLLRRRIRPFSGWIGAS